MGLLGKNLMDQINIEVFIIELFRARKEFLDGIKACEEAPL